MGSVVVDKPVAGRFVIQQSQGMDERVVDSPLGPIRIRVSGGVLTALEFVEDGGESAPLHGRDWTSAGESDQDSDGRGILDQATLQLAEYLQGTRTDFDLPLEPEGTEFQRKVWAELQRISYGTTISYGELARRIGQPTASRAVGLANGRNPIAILIPCHRVIGADGSLTGYASGVERKKWLLNREGVESRG